MINTISIHIDKKSSDSLYYQIYSQIIELISQGKLANNVKLPSMRALSKQLSVNIVTVVNAYKLLQNEGYIEIRNGSGAYVRHSELKLITEVPNILIDELYSNDDIELMKSGKIVIDADIINFASNTPSKDFFPVNDFKKVILETIDADGAEVFNYQESQGYEPLRNKISELFEMHGINANPSSIQIISGAQQGIDIVAKALLNKDDCVIVENPTYIGARAVFKSRGAKIVDIEINEDGMNMDLLLSALKKYRPKIVYTMPTYQNPTGYVYSIEKRKQLIKLSNAFGFYIIEDDFLGELNYGEDKPNYLKSLDAADRVILIKSYSKLLMPGLRIGCMVVPDKLSASIIDAKHTTDISTAGLIQRAFYHYLSEGFWEKHLQNITQTYKKRYETMSNSLKKLGKYGITFYESHGGFSFWLKMPPYINTNKLYNLAAKHGVAFIPGSIYTTSYGTSINFIRLSFTQVDEREIELGIAILEKCMSDMEKGLKMSQGTVL